ncbi:hypothetical protein PACTADRAFT_14911 [Pachysolen tannophilus NRRL Y-2460]|uniref:Uncharacterized protein n=1 Tax=Pachysolen tannophilus NRRL Y-2460 TaxID=669874 RepID=A0A1E4U386_PACTA|nr:hypothetical protein PACTADRAFT_14911 [Pachysolen tannophilus NRRL Y-2460]
MVGSIVRTFNWDVHNEQRYLAVNREDVSLYQTDNSAKNEDESIVKLSTKTGFDSINCSNYSQKDVGLTCVGQINGNAYVFDITSPSSSLLSLKPKQSRPCNSISFNNNGLLALGFDKARQDTSLQIWNIEHYSKIGSNDHISKPLMSYVQNEVVLSTCFHPEEQNNLITGSYKFLREFDLRSEKPVFQLASTCTAGIAVDPFTPYLFASYGEDGTLSVWDRRKLTSINKNLPASKAANASSHANVVSEGPLLTFNKLLNDTRKNTYSAACFRYSSLRRGEFSTLFNGDLIRRWNTGIVPPLRSEIKKYETFLHSNNNHLEGNAHISKPSESLFVVKVNDVKTKYERVISFDYNPDPNSPFGINFVCMRQSGSVYRMSVVESPTALELDSFNDIVFSGVSGTFTKLVKDVVEQKITEDKPNKATASELNNHNAISSATNGNRRFSKNIDNLASSTEINSGGNHKGEKGEDRDVEKRINFDDDEGDEEKEEEDIEDAEEEEEGDDILLSPLEGESRSGSHDIYTVGDSLIDPEELLENDISSTIRRRTMLGYGTNCEKNIALVESLITVESNLHLRNTWRWLAISGESLRSKTMISNNVDLGYEGVLGIWNGVESFVNQRRCRFALDEKRFIKAVKEIVSVRSETHAQNLSIDINSDKYSQRRLCLYVVGWDFTKQELDDRLKLLVEKGKYEKAAGWAVFHGDVLKAVEILGNSKKERLRIMSTAIAGYVAYKDIPNNAPWKEQCRRMASELGDPYLRSIFAFIADNDWWDVLDESSLPLQEKLGVALRFLSDRDLSIYLNRIADKAINSGELEGLILTGITPKGVDLLQSYVDKTSDVQTAALISSFGCPRYFNDERVEHWVESYRTLLNSWSLFNVRAKFDVARSKLSEAFTGDLTIKPVQRQVFLQCSRCNKNIFQPTKANHNIKRFNGTNNSSASVVASNSAASRFGKPDTAKGKCPHCGASLPRCAICLLTLGSPIPDEIANGFVGASSRANAGSGANANTNASANANASAGDSDKTQMAAHAKNDRNNNSNHHHQHHYGGREFSFIESNGGGAVALGGSAAAATTNNTIERKFKEWFSFCLSCNHGMHSGHAEEWFSKHYVCPVPDCNCRCNSK